MKSSCTADPATRPNTKKAPASTNTDRFSDLQSGYLPPPIPVFAAALEAVDTNEKNLVKNVERLTQYPMPDPLVLLTARNIPHLTASILGMRSAWSSVVMDSLMSTVSITPNTNLGFSQKLWKECLAPRLPASPDQVAGSSIKTG